MRAVKRILYIGFILFDVALLITLSVFAVWHSVFDARHGWYDPDLAVGMVLAMLLVLWLISSLFMMPRLQHSRRVRHQH